MSDRLSVLLVEDSPAEARLFREMLKDTPGASETMQVVSVSTLDDARGWLKDHGSDVIVLDLGLPDSTGLDTLRNVRTSAPETPVVVLTGLDDEAMGIEAIRSGAYEYLIKGRTDGRGVTRTLRYAVEQQRAMEALRSSETRLRALIDNSFDVVAVLDASGVFRFVSRASIAVIGRSPQTLVGVNASTLIHPEDVPASEQTLSRCLAQRRKPVSIRQRVLHADGSWRWIDVVAINRLDDPAVAGIVVHFSDVSEQVELEQEQIALRKASAELLDTLEVTALAAKVCRIAVERLGLDAAWVGYAEEDGTVTALAGWPEIPPHILAVPVRWDESPAGQGPTGRAIRSLTPVVCRDVTTDERFATWRAAAAGSGIRASAALPLISRDRRFGVLNAYSFRPAFFTPSRIDTFAAYAHHAAATLENARLYETLARELAEREKIESQLRQAQKMEAVGRLAGGIAHDFNSLLTAIIGYAELARDVAEPGSRLESDIREVLKAADRAASLTKQLLAFGRRQMMLPERIDLADLVKDMRRILMPVLNEHITLSVNADRGLPAIHADRDQIEQVVLNLAVNARDAMEKGGELRMSVTCGPAPDGTEGSDWVVLTVSDTGCGMDADTASRVFEPFFTTKERGKGVGLGLATVYGIVKQSGGHIGVESTPGHGSTFRVWFRGMTGDTGRAATLPR